MHTPAAGMQVVRASGAEAGFHARRMHKEKPYSHRSFNLHIIKLFHQVASSSYERFCHGSVLILCPFADLDTLAASACVESTRALVYFSRTIRGTKTYSSVSL